MNRNIRILLALAVISAATLGGAFLARSEFSNHTAASNSAISGKAAPDPGLNGSPENSFAQGSVEPGSGASSVAWVQLDRLRYVEGTVQSLQKNSDGTAALSLKTTVNYHSGTDPLDDPNAPFPVGQAQNFILQGVPKANIKSGDSVVVYECDVSPASKPDRQFTGAAVLYVKKDGSCLDKDGKVCAMPPQNYPEFRQVFQ